MASGRLASGRWSPTRYHPGMGDLAVVLVIVLVLVLLWRGPRMLPRLGEALGRGVREARDAARSGKNAEPPEPEDERRV